MPEATAARATARCCRECAGSAPPRDTMMRIAQSMRERIAVWQAFRVVLSRLTCIVRAVFAGALKAAMVASGMAVLALVPQVLAADAAMGATAGTLAAQAGRPAVPLPDTSHTTPATHHSTPATPAHPAQSQAAAPHAAPPPASIPGFRPPPAGASSAPGTTASGRVRTQPAHMPFYVATRGNTTLYLLGTLHVGEPSDYPPQHPFRRPILGALYASPTLALELSPDDLLTSQDDVSKYGVCRNPCLPKLLPEPVWHKVEARLRGNPAALDGIRKMRPWLASLVVETYDSLSAGLQTEYGTEAQLQNVYLRTRGKIVGLETLSEQMRAFTNLNLAQQREMLEQDLVQTPAQNVADVKTLVRLWRIGDADAIAAWQTAKSEKLARDKRVSASIDNRIVYDRNRRFVSRMLMIAAPNKPVFVAIGALHLGGRRGVLQLLRQRGFVVDAY